MLEQFIVQGETHLNGEVTISGAKNAAVAIIPATILAQGKCVIENIPNISDIKVLFQILRALGASVQMLDRTTVEIDTTHIVEPVVPYELARYKMCIRDRSVATSTRISPFLNADSAR